MTEVLTANTYTPVLYLSVEVAQYQRWEYYRLFVTFRRGLKICKLPSFFFRIEFFVLFFIYCFMTLFFRP